MLLAAAVSKEAKWAFFHVRRVGPGRALSWMGHVGRRFMRCVARRGPWVGVAWWKDVSHVLGAVVGDFDTTCVPHLP